VSFRRRLLLFFLIIVVVPMMSVALVLFAITADSETGKADARIAAGLRSSFALYAEARARTTRDLDRVASDPALVSALAAGEEDRVARRAAVLERANPAIVAIGVFEPGGRPIARVGSPSAVAFAAAAPAVRGRGRLGLLTVSITEAAPLAAELKRFSGLESRVSRAGRVLGSTLPGGAPAEPEAGELTVRGREYRGRQQPVGEPVGPPTSIGVYELSQGLRSSIERSRVLIAVFLIIFFLAALAGSLLVVRALQGRLQQLLDAARRLGRGDFSRSVPVSGGDEFAALGSEFNRMSEELAGKIEVVERQRDELERTIRLVGDAFAAGLDRQGTVDVAVRTAVEACSAVAGRALPADSREMRPSWVGERDPDTVAALEAAERHAFAFGATDGADYATDGNEPDRPRMATSYLAGVHGLAVPVRARLGAGADVEEVGVISIARRGIRFGDAERDIFGYLAAQAAVSIENAALHEAVQVQAVTDGLTGLYNARHFHDTLAREIERSERFRNDVGLVLLDLDDFKQVNDTFGHQQGDVVLLEVARVLKRMTRDIDEPARYGGEEMAIVLPQADSSGGERLAERVRASVEALRIPRLDGRGSISVTASFGVASLHDSEADKDGLVAAADAALYRAKRAGKNRVQRAEGVVASR
jgi:diguanylate cyclase (GGDEF)-like protein